MEREWIFVGNNRLVDVATMEEEATIAISLRNDDPVLFPGRGVNFLQETLGLPVFALLEALVLLGKGHRMQWLCNRIDVGIEVGFVFLAWDSATSQLR